MTHTRRELTALLEAHGLSASRALGQNFVVDPNTVRRIARLAAVGPGDHVVEIGAGLGSLTLALADTGAAVTAIEMDRHLLPVLAEVLDGTGVTLVAGGCPRGRLGGVDRAGADLDARGEPALQHRHAVGVRPARRRAGHRTHAGDGAARSR